MDYLMENDDTIKNVAPSHEGSRSWAYDMINDCVYSVGGYFGENFEADV